MPSLAPSLEAGARYQPGQRIAGKYRLVRRLGAGGMGVVWVAHNEVLDVHVAVKVIDVSHKSRPKQVLARVVQEARTAARLAHPAICRVFDFGETHLGDPYIVSELLHGDTLADQVEAEPRIPALRAVQLLLPIVEGLTIAHKAGIVHRDVKPENIFLARDVVLRLQPKLLDFGIARFIETDQKLTLDGTLLGTPDYMSPEQARGQGNVDHRTDVWSLCVVLYEIITGHTPFGADNYNALLWAIAQEEPRPTVDFGAGDDKLWAILERGLLKDREQRWATMRDLGEALALWLVANGVNEDICGSSLRSTWLGVEEDGTFPENEPGSRPRLRDDAQQLATALGQAEVITIPAPASPVPDGFTRQPGAPAAAGGGRWGRLVAVASAAVLGGVLLGVSLLGPAPPADAGLDGNAPLDSRGRTLMLAAPGPAVSVIALEPAPAASGEASQEEANDAGAAASASASALVRRAPVYYRPRAKRLDPKSYDFGF